MTRAVAERRVWTVEAVRALGVRTDLATAGQIILGVGRSRSWELFHLGQLPFPATRVGRGVVVPVAPLLAILASYDEQAADLAASVGAMTADPNAYPPTDRFPEDAAGQRLDREDTEYRALHESMFGHVPEEDRAAARADAKRKLAEANERRQARGIPPPDRGQRLTDALRTLHRAAADAAMAGATVEEIDEEVRTGLVQAARWVSVAERRHAQSG